MDDNKKGRIVVLYFAEGEPDGGDYSAVVPDWQESAWSVTGAEEALGRLERFITKKVGKNESESTTE